MPNILNRDHWEHDHPLASLAHIGTQAILVSIGMLVDHWYKTTLNESSWKVLKGNMHIGVKYNDLYPTHGDLMRRVTKRSRDVELTVVAQTLSVYVISGTPETIGTRLHPRSSAFGV